MKAPFLSTLFFASIISLQSCSMAEEEVKIINYEQQTAELITKNKIVLKKYVDDTDKYLDIVKQGWVSNLKLIKDTNELKKIKIQFEVYGKISQNTNFYSYDQIAKPSNSNYFMPYFLYGTSDDFYVYAKYGRDSLLVKHSRESGSNILSEELFNYTLKKGLKNIKTSRYSLILSTEKYKLPACTAILKRFIPGEAILVITLIDNYTGNIIDYFKFYVTNSDKLNYTFNEGNYQNSDNNAKRAIIDDFNNQMNFQLDYQLNRRYNVNGKYNQLGIVMNVLEDHL